MPRAPDPDARRLTLKALRMLESVARHGSMARAAAELSITQAAVSKAIGEMERAIGQPVLERSPRGVVTTEAGRMLVDRARTVLDELDEGMREIRALSDPSTGQVIIGTTEPMAALMSAMLDRLGRTHPGVVCDVRISDTGSLLRGLRERELDLVLTRWVDDPAAQDIHADPLFPEQMAVLAARRHPLARRRRLVLADVASERWTLSPPDTMLGVLAREAFEQAGVPMPRPAVVTVSIYMRLNLVHTGRFLTLLPRLTIRHPMNRSWLTALPIALPRTPGTIALLRLARRRPSATAELFRRVATQVAGDA